MVLHAATQEQTYLLSDAGRYIMTIMRASTQDETVPAPNSPKQVLLMYILGPTVNSAADATNPACPNTYYTAILPMVLVHEVMQDLDHIHILWGSKWNSFTHLEQWA